MPWRSTEKDATAKSPCVAPGTAATDQRGRFLISGVSGGVRLRASAAGFNPVDTSLCARSPMIVRLGGSFDGIDLGRSLRLTKRSGWRFGGAPEAVARAATDLTVDTLPESGAAQVVFRAPHGLAFRPGTGNPATPPQFGPARSIELDLLTQCGWLFVRTRGGGTAAVRIGSYGIDQPPGRRAGSDARLRDAAAALTPAISAGCRQSSARCGF